METPRSRAPAATAPLIAASVTPQEQAVLAAIRDTSYGAIEVVIHQSRIVQIVRTEKLKVEDPGPGP